MMRFKLEADASIETITIQMNGSFDKDGKRTHRIVVEGYLSHSDLWSDEDKQKFTVDFPADEKECSELVKLLETRIGNSFEKYPK